MMSGVMSRKEGTMARTTTKRRGAAQGQIALEIELMATPAAAHPAARAKLAPRYGSSLSAPRQDEPAPGSNVDAPPADDRLPPSRSTYVEERASAEPFGRWLIGKKIKGDESAIGVLAATAASDSSFPKTGSPDDVRKHLNARGADWDMFEAVDDAESAWAARSQAAL